MVNQINNCALNKFYERAKEKEEQSAEHTRQLERTKHEMDNKIILMKKVMTRIEKIVATFQRG